MIRVRGARVHNLKGLDVDLPRGALTVVTGPSGSGKSSLAFDTLFAESQRRYVEALGAHTRKHVEQLPPPDVDSIEGLSPAIAVRQEPPATNARSTVGTLTEVHDFVRVLFAKLGVAHCPDCGAPIRGYSVREVVDQLDQQPTGSRFVIRAPIVRGRAGNLEPELARLRKEGYVRAVLDGAPIDLADAIHPDPKLTHDLDAVIDRLTRKQDARPRLTEAVEMAYRLGGGLVRLAIEGAEPVLLSEQARCLTCDRTIPPPTTRALSWNTPEGACPACDGLGVEAPPAKPRRGKPSDDDDDLGEPGSKPCPACGGARLRPESRAIRWGGRSLPEAEDRSSSAFLEWLTRTLEAETDPARAAIAAPLAREIRARLEKLTELGVGYVSLSRPTSTLSSGEVQRIRLGTRLGASLVGLLYVLDEPSVGLHPRDTARLLATLETLRDQGNTVVLVEHDLDLVRAAQHVVELGPGAGITGGELLYVGEPDGLARAPRSVTAPWLDGRARLHRRGRPVADDTPRMRLHVGALHNLRDVTVDFPLGRLVMVTGVSGSGKSTLVMTALQRAVRDRLAGLTAPLEGAEPITRILAIDQRPIGRTPRSTPATYVGLMAPLRELYATLPEARARGYDAARFSANVKGGRCETCLGAGTLEVELALLPNVHVTCSSCHGARYHPETLDVRYRGLSIADALDQSIDAAADLFAAIPALHDRLATLRELGLGYLTLGQSATTLSGGEAQRLRLARELSRRSTAPTLYLLDEPTTGLHPSDVAVLLEVLDKLVAEGHSVVVVEHGMDLVAAADWVIDLGPDGGDAGGRVVAVGSPAGLASTPTHTGRALAACLGFGEGGPGARSGPPTERTLARQAGAKRTSR